MRVAIFSDVHGNLPALEAVLADMQRRGPFDQIVAAGDLVWSGPWPSQVVDLVRSTATAVVQGNTDAFFTRPPTDIPPGKQAERFASQLAWMQEQLGPERVSYLARLPLSHCITTPGLAGHDLLIVHATPHDQARPVVSRLSDADLDELLLVDDREPSWAALAFGHVHTPFQRLWRNRLLVNVASAGLPMDGDLRAVYAVLTIDGSGWHAEHHRVFYPVPEVTHQMRSSGMPRGKHFAERLVNASYNPMGLGE